MNMSSFTTIPAVNPTCTNSGAAFENQASTTTAVKLGISIAYKIERHNFNQQISNGYKTKLDKLVRIRNLACKRHNWAVQEAYNDRIDNLFNNWNVYGGNVRDFAHFISGMIYTAYKFDYIVETEMDYTTGMFSSVCISSKDGDMLFHRVF